MPEYLQPETAIENHRVRIQQGDKNKEEIKTSNFPRIVMLLIFPNPKIQVLHNRVFSRQYFPTKNIPATKKPFNK